MPDNSPQRLVLEPMPQITQTQTIEDGCIVIRTTWEDQKRLAAWNWKMINMMARDLENRRARGEE